MSAKLDYEMDQRIWERWLCENESRERDPFALPIVQLDKIVGTIDAYIDPADVRDEEDPEVSVGLETSTTT